MKQARTALREARLRAGLTQAGLAQRAHTSQPTIASYERGHREPTLPTLERLVGAAGYDLELLLQPRRVRPLTREERRSLSLHCEIAQRLLDKPDVVLAKARENLQTMRHANADGSADRWLDVWGQLLATGSVAAIVAVLTSDDEHSRELRQNTPFAGVLTDFERRSVYERFRREEHAARSA